MFPKGNLRAGYLAFRYQINRAPPITNRLILMARNIAA